jgi:hypothetical protein
MPVFLSNGFFISEFLADNGGGSAYDTDGDGTKNKADEYVEIQTYKDGAQSLAGMQIWSAKRGLLYSFGGSDSTASNGTATLVGQYTGAEPSGYFDAGLPDNNSNQGLLEDGENNKYDTLYLVDTNTGEYIALRYGDPPRSQALPSGFTGTNLVGTESITTNAPNGVAVHRNAAGDLVEGSPSPGSPGPVCFAAGTLIDTAAGPRRIETLVAGDRVRTRDHGLQPVRWIGACHVRAAEMRRRPQLAPVRIARGALGAGLPSRELVVSPQHRLLLQSRISDRMFGIGGVLVPALRLAELPGVSRETAARDVRYFHLLFDAHEIVFAEGCPAESLLIGPMARRLLSPEAQAEIDALFPGLIGAGAMEPARAIAAPHRARRLVARHVARRQRRLLDAHCAA